MAVKIAVTVTNAGMAVNVGGPVESLTSIIELTEDQIPSLLRKHLDERKRIKDLWQKQLQSSFLYETVTFTLVEE